MNHFVMRQLREDNLCILRSLEAGMMSGLNGVDRTERRIVDLKEKIADCDRHLAEATLPG